MAKLTQQQVADIVNNRPTGTTPEGIIAELKNRGHELEGYPLVGLTYADKTPEQQTEATRFTNTQFLQRLKLGFGGPQAEEKRAGIEEKLGLKGVMDIGDIADIVGDLIPFAGGVIGGTLGAGAGGVGVVPGTALGAAGGEVVKRGIGRVLGAREEVTPGQEVMGVAETGLLTYLGGKAIQKITEIPMVSKAIVSLTQKLPTRLMQTFFKSSLRDYELEITSGTLQELQIQNPQLFQKFVNEGLVRTGAGGKMEMNPKLALEALQRGFGTGKTGYSLDKMAGYSYIQKLNYEVAARETVRGAPKLVNLGQNKKVAQSMLEDVYGTLKKEGYGKITPAMERAQETLTKLKTFKGNEVDAETALEVRRIIDSLRNSSSFRMSPKLSPKQASFKMTADEIRGQLADQVPGLKGIMNEYRFHIAAFDDLAEEGFRRGSARIVSLADAFLGGTSMSYTAGGMQPGGGLGLMAIFRALQSPTVLSAISQGLYKTPQTMQKAFPYLLSAFGTSDPFGIREKLGQYAPEESPLKNAGSVNLEK